MNPFLQVCEALSAADCRYVIGGGFSVVMYGFNRFTPDLNIVLDMDPEALARGLQSLWGTGLRSEPESLREEFIDPARRAAWHAGSAFRFLNLQNPEIPTFCVQVYPVSPVPFEELFADSKVLTIYGKEVRVCSLEHLYRMKQIASRPQDVIDLENLDIVKKLTSDKAVEELLAQAGNDAEREQIDNLIYFRNFTLEQRIDWIIGMLEQLGRFCM